LYRKVWEVPLQRLAPEYGISDVALKKICKKMNIPTPPRGYWAKVQNGQRVPVTPLPKAKHGDLRRYEITAAADPEKKRMIEEAPHIPLLDDLERLKSWKDTISEDMEIPRNRMWKSHCFRMLTKLLISF
jgi:hypothetical protein